MPGWAVAPWPETDVTLAQNRFNERSTALERPDYSLLDTPAIIQFMFYPRPDWYPPPPGATDHEFPAQDGTILAGRFHPHSKGSPSVLFFHGNGEVASEYDGIAGLYKLATHSTLIIRETSNCEFIVTASYNLGINFNQN